MMPGTQTFRDKVVERTIYPNGKTRLKTIKHACGSETSHKYREDGTEEYKQETYPNGDFCRYHFDEKGKYCNRTVSHEEGVTKESFIDDFTREVTKTIVSRPGKEDFTIWGRVQWPTRRNNVVY